MNDTTEQLAQINRTLEGILEVMKTPENRFVRILSIVGTGVSVAGVIHLIDTVRKWIGGG